MADKKRRQSQREGRSGGGGRKRRQAGPAEVVVVEDEEYVPVEERDGEEDEVEQEEDEVSEQAARSARASKRTRNEEDDPEAIFVGSPVPVAEAHRRWPQRYKKDKIASGEIVVEEEGSVFALRHYSQAKVDGVVYKLNDTALVQSDDDKPDYICRIIEFFEGVDESLYFTAQWFYRPADTIIKDGRLKGSHDPRRVFISTIKDINPLACIVSKIKIVRTSPNIDLKLKAKTIPPCDFYYDMSYSVPYSTFMNLPPNRSSIASETSSSASSEVLVEGPNGGTKSDSEESSVACRSKRSDLSCLDLYSGCGGMSTGLCLGANLAGVNLVTKWAVDLNEYACQSLQLNHPETQVRNESAEDFLSLLMEWEKLCSEFSLIRESASGETSILISEDEESQEDDAGGDSSDSEEFEVEKFLGIRYGELPKSKKRGIMFKVRWKGYDESEDTWEPIAGLGSCQERIKDFVRKGHKMEILPLPGEVDVICGGPPCQGISGFNRFRNYKEPLEDSKNKQMVVFMDIVHFLKPKFVLMENVVDILKFAGGFLGRYALSRLVEMNYQARLGIMAAGSYGLPQYRMRVFLWGAQPTKMLPKYPLPTHDVVIRGGSPNEFEQNVVACDENHPYPLEKKLLLEHAISDLPPVTNHEKRDEMAYKKEPSTVFQQFIRLKKHECWDGEGELLLHQTLYDHKPLCLNEDDYLRVCRIPKQKGANFRNLPGVVVGPNNVVEWDPNVEREYLPSKKPLVPDYAMTFVNGKSSKPFGRLWWDETVPTVVTRAEPHNQCILHPEQDRVLTIRENARLQGFPDYYQLVGPVKERYVQVGNAVAVPVARALGHSLGYAIRGIGGDDDSPVARLPQRFPLHTQNTHGNIEILD